MGQISRRDFIRLANRGLLALGAIAVLGPVVAYFYPPDLVETPAEPVLAGNAADIPLNSSKTVRYGRYPALVIHLPQGWKAYVSVCTHFGCLVKWDAGNNQIACPCHAGFFDPQDGSVTSGPPPKALTVLKVSEVDGNIYVGGEA